MKPSAKHTAMRRGGQILDAVLRLAHRHVQPNVTTRQLDSLIAQTIERHHAKPAFLGYRGYPNASCLSVDNVVVHGLPTDSPLVAGQCLGIDVGIKCDGFYVDAAITVGVGHTDRQTQRLLRVTQQALTVGVAQAVAGHSVSAIGNAIAAYVNSQGDFGIIDELAGHGVGESLQMPPVVLNVANRQKTKLRDGMTLAIEPMLSLGDHRVVVEDDGWSVATADGSRAAQFETTIIVGRAKPEVLVEYPLTCPLS